jgi:hypothetical protein
MTAYHPEKELSELAAQKALNFRGISADPAANTPSVVASNGGAVRTLSVDAPYARAQLPLMKAAPP